MVSFTSGSITQIKNLEYIVDGLIPKNAETLILGMAGSGKSLFTEQLLTCIKYNKDFLGLKTIKNIDTLLIDQDTPTQSLILQFKKFENAITNKPEKHNEIYIESMENYSISDDSLITNIKLLLAVHKNIKLIIIDCLHKICQDMDINNTVTMMQYTTFKQKLQKYYPDLTLIVIHHISQHKNLNYDNLMTSDPAGFAMSNSVIMADADGIIVLATKTIEKGQLKELGIRPIAKRCLLNTGNFTIKFIQDSKNMQFTYEAPYIEVQAKIYNDIMNLFKTSSILNKTRKKSKIQSFSVATAFNKLEKLYCIKDLREAMAKLETEKYLKLISRRGPNQYQYTLGKNRYIKS